MSRKLSPKEAMARQKVDPEEKVGKVMGEFKSGELKSSSGAKVTNRKQAIAIGLSEAGKSKRKPLRVKAGGLSEKGWPSKLGPSKPGRKSFMSEKSGTKR